MGTNELNQATENIGVACHSFRAWLTQIREPGRAFDAREAFEETHQLNRRFTNDAARIQLAGDTLRSGLVHLVERDQSIRMFVGSDTGLIENPCQNLTVIYANNKIVEAERHQSITRRRDQLRFHHHRPRPEHIDIALIELAKSSTRGTIGSPDGLNLIA